MAKAQRTKRIMFDSEGNELKSTDWENAEKVVLDIVDSGGDPFQITRGDLPDNIRRAHEMFGLCTSLQNEASGGTDRTPQERYESVEARIGLWENGEWGERGTGEGVQNISIVAEATLRYYQQQHKREDVTLEQITKSLTDPNKSKEERKELRDNLLADPHVKSHYEDIRLERQQERAKKLRADAKKAEVSTESNPLGL